MDGLIESDVDSLQDAGEGRLADAIKTTDKKQRRAAGNIFRFLAFLLALTLIARGTNSATLARVEVTAPSRGRIVDAITGIASISAKNTLDIYAPEGLTIAEMIADAGQSMKSGDALARFDEDEVMEKLERESASLEKMLLDLELLERSESADATAMETARRNLERAQTDYNITKREGEESIEAARGVLDEALNEIADDPDVSSIASAMRNLQRAQEDYESTKEQGESDISEALTALESAENYKSADNEYSAVESALRNLQRAKDDYDTAKAQGEDDIESARAVLETAEKDQEGYAEYNAVESAQRNLQRAEDDYDTIKAQGAADIESALAALSALEAEMALGDDEGDEGEQIDSGDLLMVQTALIAAQNKAAENLLAAERRVEDAEAALAKAKQDYNNARQQSADAKKAEIDRAQSALESAKQRAGETLLSAERRVEDAEAALSKVESDYDNSAQQSSDALQNEIERAQSALESAQQRAGENLLGAERRIEDAEAALSKAESDYEDRVRQSSDSKLNEMDKALSALTTAQTRAEEDLLSARRRIEDAEASLRKAEQDYSRSEQQSSDTAEQNSVNAISLRLDINAQKSIIDALKELLINDCIFRTDLEGVVSSTMAKGNLTGKAPLASFRDGAKGYEAMMQIKKTDAYKLAVGDECEVTTGGGSMYYNPTETGIVSGISPPDETDESTVFIRLPGSDWTEGQKVEAQIVISSENYDLCVPISALRSDNSGYYILVVEQQSTVLGVQNIVVRVSVNVAASDTDMASVIGPVERNSRVITAANKAIAAGDRVRVG